MTYISINYKEIHEDGLYTGEELYVVFAEESKDKPDDDVSTSQSESSDDASSESHDDDEECGEEIVIASTCPSISDVPKNTGKKKKMHLRARYQKFFMNKMNLAATLAKSAARRRYPRMITNAPQEFVKTTNSDGSSTCVASESSWSSVTCSTCDFEEDASINEKLVHYDQWAAAKKGDYATLLVITNHSNDPAIWTQKDEFGNVPLYYACHSGGAHGKYGLKAVKLLIDSWPGKIPKGLFDRCKQNAINRDVSNMLVSKSRGTRYSLPKALSSKRNQIPENDTDEDVFVDGLSLVASIIGDDGFVEDY